MKSESGCDWVLKLISLLSVNVSVLFAIEIKSESCVAITMP